MPYNQTMTMTIDDVLSKDKLNTFVFTPIADMISPPFAVYNKPIGEANITTTSTTLTAIDDTLGKFYLQLVTKGNPVEIGVRIAVGNSAIAYTYLDVEIDGVSYTSSSVAMGVFYSAVAAAQGVISFREIVSPLAAGTHDFKLRWRVSAGTGTLYAAYKPQFYVREL